MGVLLYPKFLQHKPNVLPEFNEEKHDTIGNRLDIYRYETKGGINVNY